MNCEDLKIPLCGSCKYRLGLDAQMKISDGKCFIEFFHAMSGSYSISKDRMKEFIVFCIKDSLFAREHAYLQAMINEYYPEYINLYETVMLLK